MKLAVTCITLCAGLLSIIPGTHTRVWNRHGEKCITVADGTYWQCLNFNAHRTDFWPVSDWLVPPPA